MSDSESEQPKVEIKIVKEDDIFEKKPKPKRKLTDKQKQALAEGRAKAKAKRDKLKEAEIMKKVEKKVKKEQKDIAKAKEEDTNRRAEMKDKKAQQLSTRDRIKKQEYERKHKKYTDIKEKVLGQCETVGQYDYLTRILNGVREEDIMDDRKLKKKLHNYITTAKNLMEKSRAKK